MLNGEKYLTIPIETALHDLLREYGIELNDLFAAMIDEGIDVYRELLNRIDHVTNDIVQVIRNTPWKLVALTLFVLQAFYITNLSGLYKGYFLDPPREDIMNGLKARFTGVLVLMHRLKFLI
ncbi:hypothetical protein [Staphylothermus marinus]|uniref:hypothetical protein n=1 Tax=Staphylothermus marinus TaxID=2280 RepID=UPI0003233DA6|nr:hypothetical protein [Staphylothermus marinus]